MKLHFHINNTIRFIYILRRRDDEIYFKAYLNKLLKILKVQMLITSILYMKRLLIILRL